MLEAFLGACENGLNKNGAILDNLKELVRGLLSLEGFCDQLKLGLIS